MRSSLTHQQKLERLALLSEDQFRDEVVRPIFSILGFTSYRDLCGVDEAGKDCSFVKRDEMGAERLYVVQTKKGKLNMASKASQNVANAIAQLRTALTANVHLTNPPRTLVPNRVYLCSSGTTNSAARAHIASELSAPNLDILDAEDIIQKLDELYPTYWVNISHHKSRYLHLLGSHLLALSDVVRVPSGSSAGDLIPYCNEAYVSQTLHRFSTKLEVTRGRVETTPRLEEIQDVKLLSSNHRVAIVFGEGGSGKTTMLRHLALLVCEQSLTSNSKEECRIPVLLRSREVLQSLSLRECVEESVRRVLGESESGLSDDDFSAGRIVVLIDALDELADRAGFEHVLSLSDEFVKLFPSCRVVLTSRPLMVVRDFASKRSLPVFQISEFNLKQASSLVRRSMEGDQSSAIEVLRRLQEVHGMKLNPLLVTLFASTPNFQSSDIPPNITQIFKKFTSMMLGLWDQNKGLTQQFEWDVKHRILSAVAWDWHSARVTEVTYDEFVKTASTILAKKGYKEKTEAFIAELLSCGLIVQDGNYVSFRHLLLQEYFAGSRSLSESELSEMLNDSWWRNVIVFNYGSRPEDGDQLLTWLPMGVKGESLDTYESLITLGLALQACYMTDVQTKKDLFGKLLGAFSDLYAGVLRRSEDGSDFPLSAFIFHFLESRCAVSSELVLEATIPEIPESSREYFEFLMYTGAIESGQIERVKQQVENFDPEDKRLLLGLHLLAFFVQKLRVATKSERISASSISASIAPKISPLIQQALREFNGMVLEYQQGKIRVLDAPLSTPEGQYELPYELGAGQGT